MLEISIQYKSFLEPMFVQSKKYTSQKWFDTVTLLLFIFSCL